MKHSIKRRLNRTKTYVSNIKNESFINKKSSLNPFTYNIKKLSTFKDEVDNMLCPINENLNNEKQSEKIITSFHADFSTEDLQNMIEKQLQSCFQKVVLNSCLLDAVIAIYHKNDQIFSLTEDNT